MPLGKWRVLLLPFSLLLFIQCTGKKPDFIIGDKRTFSFAPAEITLVYVAGNEKSEMDNSSLTEPMRSVDNPANPIQGGINGSAAPFMKEDASGFRLLSTTVWETALRVETGEYQKNGKPDRQWFFPDLDGPNSEWCFDFDPLFEEPLRS